MSDKRHPIEDYDLETAICVNCGETIFLDREGWIHKWDRWAPVDNGYFCFQNNQKLHARPKVKD